MPTQPAILGTARLGNFRLGYVPAALRAIRATRIRIYLDGELATTRVRRAGFTIRDVLNDAPNTCSLTIEGTPPPESGMALRVTINSDTPRLLFNGTLQVDGETFDGRPSQIAYPCHAIDDTARLNYLRPFGLFASVSATTVAQQLVAQFAPGMTATGVQAGLPLVTVAFDGTEGFSGCLRQLAKIIGGYFYVEDLDVHLFLTEATETPAPITGAPPLQYEPKITQTHDDSQLRTRVYGRGHAEALLADCGVGETILPIADTVMFTALGGRAIASVTPDGSATERLTYTGLLPGGAGALVGPGVVPSVAPTLALATGAGLGAGVYTYGYTWVTAGGETLPSPVAPVTTGDAVTPTVTPTTTANPAFSTSGGAYAIGDTLRCALTYSADFAGVVGMSDFAVGGLVTVPASTPNPGLPAAMNAAWTLPAAPPAIAKYWHLWVSKNGAVYQKEIANPVIAGVAYTSPLSQFATGPGYPGLSVTARQVASSGIALGPAGTTARKVYRTAAGGSQLKLQQTIANNTATVGVVDATPDASLGANAPTSDTSGLVQTFGQVNAGSATLPTSGAAPFAAAGGWVRTSAGDLVRYTGITGNTLTGIPAAGSGAIVTSILYNSQVVAVPVLIGVAGLTTALAKGARVHVWVQRDDLSAQAAAAARESTATYASSGIHEHLIIDERRAEASLAALCDADLALFARPIVTVVYATRDVKTKSGKPITISLTSPAIAEILTIQDVTIDQIDVAPGTPPRFTVTASSVRFSLEDTLRRLSAQLES